MSQGGEQRLAFVTGASRGIGAAVAARLRDAGLRVVGTATTPEGAERIASACDGGFALRLDDAEGTLQVLSAAMEEHGAPDVLVNNAGITHDALLARIDEEAWGRVIEVNLSAVYRICRAAVRPMMRKRWGRIINLGSVVGAMGNPGQSSYAASKAGMAGFGRALAAEVGSRGITVNTVEPGFIETDMTSGLPEQQREFLLQRIPLGRLGAAEEVAALVAFLASDGAGYITGERIAVNGGMYMQ